MEGEGWEGRAIIDDKRGREGRREQRMKEEGWERRGISGDKRGREERGIEEKKMESERDGKEGQ